MPSPDRLTNYADKHPDFLRAIQASLGTVGRSAAERLADAERNGGDGYGSGFEAITNPETKVAFETAIDAVTTLYARIGRQAPTPEELVDLYGVDFASKAALWRTEKDLGHEPEIILAPRELPVADAKALYQNLQDDPTVNHDGRIQNSGLFISRGVFTNWNTLLKPKSGEPDWTLRIIPGTPTPTIVNISHYGKDKHGNQLAPPTHPTIPEYLTLQATRLQADRTPIDANNNDVVWLDGKFMLTVLRTGRTIDLSSPHGGWFPSDGQVRVGWSSVLERNAFLGSRSPVG